MCRGSSKERLAGPSPRGAEAEGPWPGGPGRPGTSICEEQRQGGVLKAPRGGRAREPRGHEADHTDPLREKAWIRAGGGGRGRALENQQLVPGRGLRAESLLAPEAGPSEGLPLPVLPSALGCSAPETGWSWERKRAGGQPLPHSSHPSAVCCPEKLVRLPTGLQCTHAHLTTPRGSGRCSLTLRAWLQGRREESVPGRLHPIFINVTTGLAHKCPPTPFPNSRGSPLDSEAASGTWGGKSRYLGLVSYPPQLDQAGLPPLTSLGAGHNVTSNKPGACVREYNAVTQALSHWQAPMCSCGFCLKKEREELRSTQLHEPCHARSWVRLWGRMPILTWSQCRYHHHS